MSERIPLQDDCSVPPEPLSLYVHVPFCARKCRYCSFYSVAYDPIRAEAWSQSILKELDLYHLEQPFQTLYIGGGSPTVLSAELLGFLIDRLLQQIGPVEELTVEINPAQADAEFLAVLKESGVNRLSVGAQSFHPEELAFLGRLHRTEDIENCIRLAKRHGFENIGLDLIFAVPGSTLESWVYSLQKALAVDIVHLSAYSLSYEQGTPIFNDLEEKKIVPVDEDTDRQMYETAIDLLAEAGFEQYEISNFARPGFACRHNLHYWDNRPWLGLGPSAASWFKGQRTQNIADLDSYIETIQQGCFAFQEVLRPTPLTIAWETVVLNLRKTEGINRQIFLNQTGFDLMELFAEPIRKYTSLGLLEVTSDFLRLTRPARSIADSIFSDFVIL